MDGFGSWVGLWVLTSKRDVETDGKDRDGNGYGGIRMYYNHADPTLTKKEAHGRYWRDIMKC